MGIRETIAIVGIAKGNCIALANKLARENYRLLLVTNNEIDLREASDHLISQAPTGAIEVIDCVKNGCWEADIIVLLGTVCFEKELLDKISQFATQKVVAGISVSTSTDPSVAFEMKNIQPLLPHSKVVHVFNKVGSITAFIAGEEEEAVRTVSDIAHAIGYNAVIVESLSGIISQVKNLKN